MAAELAPICGRTAGDKPLAAFWRGCGRAPARRRRGAAERPANRCGAARRRAPGSGPAGMTAQGTGLSAQSWPFVMQCSAQELPQGTEQE